MISTIARTAWIPIVEPSDGAPSDSKFGGTPWLPSGESWPACPNCRRPMQSFLQLATRDLPEPMKSRLEGKTLQFFYCTSSDPHCEVDCEAWVPFSRSTLLRLIAPSGEGARASETPVDAFAPKRIVGWKAADDLPNDEELEALGVDATLPDDRETPLPHDKLGGWPCWVQSVEYPSCPNCAATMELLFQLDSEDNVPYMFGDVGCGHVTQCPNHREVLAFGWACC